MARITVKILRMAYSLAHWEFGLEASMLQVLFQRTGRAWAGESGEPTRPTANRTSSVHLDNLHPISALPRRILLQ